MEDYKSIKVADRWASLEGKKSGVLTRAEECSKLTIPSVFPPNGYLDWNDSCEQTCPSNISWDRCPFRETL